MAEQRAQGFTFVESLVAILLLAGAMSVAFGLLGDFGRTLNTERSTLIVQQSARVALDELARGVRQAGYGCARNDGYNPAAWQRQVVHAGSHVLAFNADLDSTLGSIPSAVTLTFPSGPTYSGEGSGTTQAGAETYLYTVDGNGNGTLEAADRTQAATGSYNPAAETPNPLDFALFRRVHGFDGVGNGGALEPFSANLFTNATADAVFPIGGSPEPLFTYVLTEDLNRDGRLDPAECVNDVVDTCPPGTPREPLLYLWGDTDFDGRLSEAEKTAVRTTEVGSTGWAPNPLVDGGSYKTTTLAQAIDPSGTAPNRISVADGTKLGRGYHIQIGSGGTAERMFVEQVFTAGTPHRVVLSSDPSNGHATGSVIVVLPSTLLHAVRSVGVTYTAIGDESDRRSGARAAGRIGLAGSFGLDYRVTEYRRTVELLNASTTAFATGGP